MISTMTRATANAFNEKSAMKLIADAGFDGVDYSMHYYPLDSFVYQKDEGQVLEYYGELGRCMQELGLQAFQLHTIYPTYVKDAELDEKLFWATVRGIRIAKELRSPYAVVHPLIPDTLADHMMTEERWALNRAFFLRLLPYIEECDIQIGIENMFSYDACRYIPNGASTAENMIFMIDSLNELMGTNRFVACQDIPRMIQLLDKRLKLLHLHDNCRADDSHTLPYLGDIDWKEILSALKKVNYQGIFSFEADGFISRFPPALVPQALSMIAAVGRSFEQDGRNAALC